MKISIVIVNYNVEFFLEQCLNSVFRASQEIESEIIVVDNNSVDGSVQMVKTKFPEVILIENKENTGFSVANNQAIKISKGEFVLLLNPDTLVQEDNFRKVLAFMENHPEAGGLGVKMIDGKGNFLPESKRGLPTPAIAFYKIFGLSKFFPKSQKFGRYHLGFLDKDKTHEVDILSGAYMLLRKSVLNTIGLLDEKFFMYGEDIDLSYRITQAGYKNYYFADSQIIHYKGESTKKGSLNYVFVFYKAMVIFAQKHFSSNNAIVFSLFINTAIWFRASLSVLARFIKIVLLPVIDFSLILFGIGLASSWYEDYSGKILDNSITKYAYPALAALWIIVSFFSSVYDRPFRIIKMLWAAIYASGLVLAIYSLLPEELRSSRAMVLIGCLIATLWFFTSRFILKWCNIGFYGISILKSRKFAIVGYHEECVRITKMIQTTHPFKSDFFEVNPENLHQLNDFVRINRVQEIVFSGKDLSSQQIIDQMTVIESPDLDFKIAPPESLFIIGSNSIDTQGDYYMLEMTGIQSAVSKRNKRLTDLLLSLIFFIFSPILILTQANKIGFLKNLLLCFIGEISWVGFNKVYTQSLNSNSIKKAVVPIVADQIDKEIILKSNMLYARNYSWQKDVAIVLKNLKQLGGDAG